MTVCAGDWSRDTGGDMDELGSPKRVTLDGAWVALFVAAQQQVRPSSLQRAVLLGAGVNARTYQHYDESDDARACM